MLKHKILGLDVGSKTVGIAISDLMGWTAQGLDTLRINEEQDDLGIDQLVKIIKDNQVGTVVIGLPKNMNNSIGFRGEASIKYKEKLQESIPSIDIVMWDERLSTMAAERSLLEADVSRQKRKKVIDKMAAVFILQGYLDSIQYKGEIKNDRT
ncbi:Holliday junction resolvase RuvX [Staphylococcus epidermidis]|nr:Holliday junction resolvase RuvX [Staphylococcus epidermidis]